MPQKSLLWAKKLAFFGQKKRFFGDGCSGTLDHLLQNTAKHAFLSPASSKKGMEPYL